MMTATEISDLPEEVLRIIFKMLDGKTLFRVACVCTFWHRIVHELKRNVEMWSRFCMTEIPMPLLAEMTGLVDVNNLSQPENLKKHPENIRSIPYEPLNLSPDSKTTDNNSSIRTLFDDEKRRRISIRLPWQFWREVYLAYRRTSLISRWPCLRRNVTQTLDNNGKTMCLKFHGNLLLTGHENGAVLCWNNPGTIFQNGTVLHRHRSTVTALAVVDSSNLENGRSPEFTVISGSDDRDILFTAYDSKPLESACYNHSIAITSICSWGQYFVTGSQETILHGQWVFHLTSNLKWKRCYHLLGHICSHVRCTAIWENKVVTGDDDGNVYIWELIQTNKRYLLPLVIHKFSGPIQQTLICGDRILCLANKDVLAVSLNNENFCKFSVYDNLFRTPERFNAWGPILAIGLKSGIVAVYHLETDADWQNIDISKPLQILHSGQEHVIDLCITDSGLGLSIAFSTDDNSIHLAHWLPRLTQNQT